MNVGQYRYAIGAIQHLILATQAEMLTINPALLTIKADDKSKTYGDDDPVFGEL